MKLKAVIVALDAVLMGVASLDVEAFQHAVLKITGADIGPIKQARDFDRLTFDARMMTLYLQGIIRWDKIELVRALYHEYIFHLFSERIKRDNGIILVGEYIRNKGLSLACVTNRDYQVTLFGLERCGILSYVQYIVTFDQVPMGKPAMFGYNAALRFCETKPGEALVIESGVLGATAARNIGCRVHQLAPGIILDADLLGVLIGEEYA